MSQLKSFTFASARPLPVILLLDTSGSMKGGKIDSLNLAASDMIKKFAKEDDSEVEIQVAIITFGGEDAKLHQDLVPASKCEWHNLIPFGKTPMGAAFDMARELIENRDKIPKRDYIPTIILLSDGIPTDGERWKSALSGLLQSPRAAKAARYAISIGGDTNFEVLNAFLEGTGEKVRIQQPDKIGTFFNMVTMSVTSRSRSQNPNDTQIKPPSFDEDADY